MTRKRKEVSNIQAVVICFSFLIILASFGFLAYIMYDVMDGKLRNTHSIQQETVYLNASGNPGYVYYTEVLAFNVTNLSCTDMLQRIEIDFYGDIPMYETFNKSEYQPVYDFVRTDVEWKEQPSETVKREYLNRCNNTANPIGTTVSDYMYREDFPFCKNKSVLFMKLFDTNESYVIYCDTKTFKKMVTRRDMAMRAHNE